MRLPLSALAAPFFLLVGIGCGDVIALDPGESGVAAAATSSGAGGAGGGGSTSAASTGSGGSAVCPTGAWAKRFGDAEDQRGHAVAVDAACNVFVAATVVSTIDFGDGTLKGTKFYEGSTLAKLDAHGDAVWSRWLESSKGGVGIGAIAVDASGGLLVTGVLRGSFDFGTGPIVAGPHGDVYAARLDPQGQASWVRSFSGTNSFNQYGSHLAVSASGEVVISGAFNGTVDFGNGPLTSLGEDIFLLELDAKGGTMWSKRFGGPGNTLDQIVSIAIGAADEIVIAGDYEGALDLGAGPLPWSYSGELVAMLDPTGKALWSQTVPDARCGYNACPMSVAVTPEGGVVIAGAKVDDPVNPDQPSHVFRRVLDAKGGLVATHDLEGVVVRGVAGAGSGDWFLAGAVGGAVVARVDADGSEVWGRGLLTPYSPVVDDGAGALGIAVDPAGNVIVVGTFSGALDFGAGVLKSAGKRDVFVARLNAE